MPTYLNFPTVVSPSTYSKNIKNKIKSVQFGDGYTQETPDGINFKAYTFSLAWEMLTTAEKDTINNFLYARGGYQTFNWTNPEDSVTYKVKCREWSVDYVNPNVWRITATLEQKFY